MKSFNFKKVLSISFASLTMFSGFCGLNSAKVSAAPVRNSSVVNSEAAFTMKSLNTLIDYNPNVNFDEKQNDIKKGISQFADLMKEDQSKDAWYRSIVKFSEILFTKFKNDRGYLGFTKSDMVILSVLSGLDNISIFKPLNSIREILLNKGSEEIQHELCNEVVLDFLNSNELI